MFEILDIKDLNLDKFNLIREVNNSNKDEIRSRKVYHDQSNKNYIKIWDKNDIRAVTGNFIKAILCGFYDKNTVPALKSIIFDGRDCVGYVMGEGVLLSKFNEKLPIYFKDMIFEKTKTTGYCFIDLTTDNIIKYKSGCSLIDLEPVYHIDNIDKRFTIKPVEYANYIKELK